MSAYAKDTDVSVERSQTEVTRHRSLLAVLPDERNDCAERVRWIETMDRRHRKTLQRARLWATCGRRTIENAEGIG